MGYIVDAGEPLYYGSDFQYAITDGEAKIKRYIGSGGDMEIPKTLSGFTITKIGNYAFENCKTLTNTERYGSARLRPRV